MPRPSPEKIARVAQLLLAVGLLGALMHVAWVAGLGQGEIDSLVDDWIYNAVLAIAAAVCMLKALISRERLAWFAVGLGLAFWTAADVYWTVALADLKHPPYPSLADALYLAVYPCMYVGVLSFVRNRVRLSPSNWLDGAIGALATAALATLILAPALVGVTKGDEATVITNLAYPLGDVLLLSFLVAGMTLAGTKGGRAFWLLAAGITTWAVADAVYLMQEASGTYDGGYLDSMWPIGGLLIGSAAAFSVDPSGERRHLHTVVFPALFATVALVVIAWGLLSAAQAISAEDRWAVWLALSALVAVVLRFILAFRENTALMRKIRRESLTDALTGLANRRALWRDLERLLGRRTPTAIAFFDLDGFKAYNDSFGHPAGDLLLRRMGEALASAVAPDGKAYRLGGDEFCALVPSDAKDAEARLAAAHRALFEEGQGFRIGSSFGVARLPEEATDPSQALRVVDARMYAEKGRRSNSAQRQTHDVLVRILREREPALSDHLAGVAHLAVRMGRHLGLGAEDLDALTRAAQLHDVGKIAIPDRILHKPGPLDAVEWELMRSHTEIGERILRAAPAMNPVADLVRSSHERWDGDGYPDGLSGEEIPLGSRIIFVCDAFEAMTSERSYRLPMSPEEARAELKRCAGTQFDPALVELFVEQIFDEIQAAPAAASR